MASSHSHTPIISAAITSPPLDVVRPHPLCGETPPPALQHDITPAPHVYVRSNFDTPPLDGTHRVQVGGAVAAPFTIGMDELLALPARTVTVTMECAGNGRLGMTPLPPGEPWRHGAVSTAIWRGVPLRTLLERAGVATGAVEVLATGADHGTRDDADGDVVFARALPLADALHPDTLVATHMNGAPLTPDHGAPVRLIVPGWYGMASVKWLAALEVRTVPFDGYFQRQRYVYDTGEAVAPVMHARVKSMIVAPADGDRCGRHVMVQGWAWSGRASITRVEVQVDDGPWRTTTLGAPASTWAWTPWALPLTLPAGAAVTLRSRATDATGAVQPETIMWNRLGYGNNAIRAITVRVD